MKESTEINIDGWVARDKCGNVFLYPTEPWRGRYEWQEINQEYISIPDEFPNLTWKDEPIKVTITLKLKT